MKIYFPPRIIDTSGYTRIEIDRAVHQYIHEGIAILRNEESLREAIKIVEYAKIFPGLRPRRDGGAGALPENMA